MRENESRKKYSLIAPCREKNSERKRREREREEEVYRDGERES